MAKNLATVHTRPTTTTAAPPPLAGDARLDSNRGPRILARSLYKSLKAEGYTPRQIVAITTELIGLVTADLPQQAASRPQS